MKGRSRLTITRRRTGHSKTRNCRNLLVPSRVRRQVMAEDLDKMWVELRRHATVEPDPEKLWQLAIDIGKK